MIASASAEEWWVMLGEVASKQDDHGYTLLTASTEQVLDFVITTFPRLVSTPEFLLVTALFWRSWRDAAGLAGDDGWGAP